MRLFILGSGSWATALAEVLARKGYEVLICCRRRERAQEIAAHRHALLPGLALSPRVHPVLLGEPIVAPCRLAIAATPTQHLTRVLEEGGAALPRGIPWVSASKGVEISSRRRPSQIIGEAGLARGVGILSGPSHAEEVVRGVPTAVVLGHSDRSEGGEIQEILSSEAFRVYLNADAIGVEWGGALKNVIALAAGIAIGKGFGDNTLAALITRGAVEMARLGVALGGRRETFSGLSGIGDLIVTCFSEHSRNRRVGVRIGRGEPLAQILAGMVQVVEGVHTSRAVVELCRPRSVEMPITEEVHRICHEGKDVEAGVQALLRRSLKEE